MSKQQQEFREFKKTLPKLHGKIIVDEIIDPVYREMLISKRRRQKTRRIEKRDKPLKKDTKIYIHKYYPWCWRDYKKTLVLQGWYNVKKAKAAYLKRFGPDALKYVKFIRGIRAIKEGFDIGNTLFINNRWTRVGSKYELMGYKVNKPLKRTLVSLIETKKDVDDLISYYQNERTRKRTIYKTDSIKKSRLQKRREIDNERKKNLYINPDDI